MAWEKDMSLGDLEAFLEDPANVELIPEEDLDDVLSALHIDAERALKSARDIIEREIHGSGNDVGGGGGRGNAFVLGGPFVFSGGYMVVEGRLPSRSKSSAGPNPAFVFLARRATQSLAVAALVQWLPGSAP